MSFDNIKLEKGLYTTGKSFTSALEAIDPSENYRGTSLEGLDAYERQLKRFDIKVSGPETDSISKFFSTASSSVLFPEYISRAVKAGYDQGDKVEKIIATTTNIDSLDYRSINFSNSMNFSLNTVNEGETFSECEISLNSELTKLKKYGTILSATYEAIKFQKLDVFSVALKRIGEVISNDQFATAIDTLGDSSGVKNIKYDADSLGYSDLVDLWASCNPFNMNVVVANSKTTANILKMPEFRDANAGLDFHGTGKIITPFGAELIVSNIIDDGLIIGLDKNNALEKVQATGIVTEFDKLIDRQIERASISTIVGFSPIYSESVAVLQTK